MLHYTVCPTYESTLSAYYGTGVSAHYTIEDNGTPHYNVSTSNVAFHAGASQFRGFTSLNRSFIGIEHVHPGYVESEVIYDSKWGTPVSRSGDSRLWFPFSNEQFVSSCTLTAQLQKKHRIPGSLVITHADAAIGRKSDVGPMWNYKKAFTEFGIGYFPEKRTINLSQFSNLTDENYIKLIRMYGYKAQDSDNRVGEIKAFQMHFSTDNISGELVESTRRDVINLVIDYYQYNDPFGGYDDNFRRKIDEFCTKFPEATGGFSEFI